MKIVLDTDRLKARLPSRPTLPDDMFPPETSLLKLPIVVWTFWVVVIVAFAMAVSVLCTSWPLHLNFSAKGYEDAAQLFKAPIAIVLLLIPLLALYASNHRSVQTMRQMSLTTKQIEVATGQNLFANYYKHIEEFSKWCDSVREGTAVKSRRRLHKMLFPQAKEGRLHLEKAVLDDIDAYVTTIADLFGKIPVSGKLSILQNMRTVTQIFASRYCLVAPPATGEDYELLEIGRESIVLPPGGPRQFCQQHVEFMQLLEQILSFDENFTPSDFLLQLVKLDTSGVPSDPRMLRQTVFRPAGVA